MRQHRRIQFALKLEKYVDFFFEDFDFKDNITLQSNQMKNDIVNKLTKKNKKKELRRKK